MALLSTYIPRYTENVWFWEFLAYYHLELYLDADDNPFEKILYSAATGNVGDAVSFYTSPTTTNTDEWEFDRLLNEQPFIITLRCQFTQLILGTLHAKRHRDLEYVVGNLASMRGVCQALQLPNSIGTAIGALMMTGLSFLLLAGGYKQAKISLDSLPEAASFYEKIGMKRTDTSWFESSALPIPDRHYYQKYYPQELSLILAIQHSSALKIQRNWRKKQFLKQAYCIKKLIETIDQFITTLQESNPLYLLVQILKGILYKPTMIKTALWSSDEYRQRTPLSENYGQRLYNQLIGQRYNNCPLIQQASWASLSIANFCYQSVYYTVNRHTAEITSTNLSKTIQLTINHVNLSTTNDQQNWCVINNIGIIRINDHQDIYLYLWKHIYDALQKKYVHELECSYKMILTQPATAEYYQAKLENRTIKIFNQEKIIAMIACSSVGL